VHARLFGPLVSTADPAAHRALFRDVCGMEPGAPVSLARDDTALLFGRGASSVELSMLRTPGADSGVVLSRFSPGSDETIRSGDSKVDRDVLKVVDFYAPDFDAAIAHARACGYDVVESQAEYDLVGEATLREAHLRAPDQLLVAFLGGPAAFFADFVRVTDRRVSEAVGMTLPLSDAKASLDFARDVFGWDVVYEYAIDAPSVAELIGVDQALDVRASSIGSARHEPYLSLIDYGLPPDVGVSLRGRSVAPRRGLLGAVVLVDDLDAVRQAAGSAASGVVDLALEPFGPVRASVVLPPHEIPHLVLEVCP